ncbi:MAG: P-loop NTPase [Gemmatimonadota bacterium]|nr:P-loop NTPase [Gemmatimonadota bacterium]
MTRRALIVSGAIAAEDIESSVLRRFGFTDTVWAGTVADGLSEMRSGHFDLVMLPLLQVDAVQFAALDREVRRGRGMFVIGTAPRAEPEVILRAMRSGIHEFLTHPPEPAELATAIDRLVRRLQNEAQRGRLIAVYSGKGGLGSTTVAVNLAHAFGRNHGDLRVGLVDLIVAGGDVRVFLNLTSPYDMGDLAEKLDRLDSDLLHSLLTPCLGGVWALPGPDDADLDLVLDGNAVTAILDHFRQDFAFTVLDCEHHLSERTLAALDMADRIIILTELTVPALRSCQRTLSLCRRLGYPNEKMCVVVNRHQSNSVLSLADAGEVLKHEIYWKLPNDYRLAAGALAKGIPIAEHAREARLATSFQQLAAKLAGAGDGTSSNGGAPAARARLGRLFGLRKGA